MKNCIKYLALVFASSFMLMSCGDNDGIQQEDEVGIKIATTRSSGQSDGIGIACNLADVFKNYKDEIKDEEFENKEEFDEILEKIIGELDKTYYAVIAGDNITFEDGFDLEVEGEAFSISWYSDGTPSVGVYEAVGAKMNIQDPDNLKDGAELIGAGKIEVNLTDINDEFLVGTFKGTIESKDGETEQVDGSFNVERTSCDK